MGDKAANDGCDRCRRLERKNVELAERIARLQEELAKAKKNSRNSSKPPSSDVAKPKSGGGDKNDKNDKRKSPKKKGRGGQPGHPKHDRPLLDPSQVDFFENHNCESCPECGGGVEVSNEPPRITQQAELAAAPVTVTQHLSQPCWCPHCQKTHYAPVDEVVKRSGILGPSLTALVAYLKGACHCSFTTIRKFLRDVVKVTVSRGYLSNVIAKVAQSLADPYEELLAALRHEELLNIDETGHKDSGKRHWTWVFRAATFALFKISPSRGSDVLIETLGREFDGVIGCDYFSAYRKFMKLTGATVQFCLAHLIRDVRFLMELPHGRTAAYGRRLQERLREMFGVIHRRDEMAAEEFSAELSRAGQSLLFEATNYVPNTREAQNLKRRFELHGESYVRFITTPGIGPTNNVAEQAIRFVVIDRRVTQGSRSEGGQRWLERVWTVMATCSQQSRSVFAFLVDSVNATLFSSPSPSLVFDSS